MARTPTGWNAGRFFNVPGMSRDNAPMSPVDPGLIARVSGTLRSWLGRDVGPGSPELPFFPPGRPLDPVAPGAAGRRFDYPTNYNATIKPRTYEPIDFETLRALADPTVGGWDLIRLAIETRKDQFSKLQFSVLPRKPANAQVRPKSDERCQKLEQFLRRPDGVHSWAEWCRMLLEDHLVIDAATIYGRKDVGGNVCRMELLDGATIKPIINYDGRRPDSGPAYQQVIKGLPAIQYTADELIYAPRNPRTNKVYGYSCVEQVLVTVNIGLRRQVSQLAYFTDGTVPDAVAQVPPDWSVQKIQEFQDYWDQIVNDAVTRRKLKFIPGGAQFQATRNDQYLTDQFDEWLARIIQYCFSLPPTPLVRMMNRATAESSYEQSLDEGLQPLMTWKKNIMDDILVRWGPGVAGGPCDDLEFVYDDIRKVDPAEKEQRDLALIGQGVISRDDMRAERGIEPLGVPPIITGIGPLGFMSIDAVKKAIANGWDLQGMPQPGLGGAMGGTEASVLGTGQDGDPLNGLPPEVLDALGVKPNATEPDDNNNSVIQPNQDATPGLPSRGTPETNGPPKATNVVPMHKHPVVQQALAHGEAHAKRLASRMAAR